MFFASDNSGPVPQAVLDTLAEANQGYTFGYGADALMDEVRERIRDLFEAPEAAVYLVATGTAANNHNTRLPLRLDHRCRERSGRCGNQPAPAQTSSRAVTAATSAARRRLTAFGRRSSARRHPGCRPAGSR